MQYEKILEVAYELEETTLRLEEELAQAKLKANEEAGILGYSSYSNGFHVTEEKFLEITNGDAFTIKEIDNDYYKYEYQYYVKGRLFFCISNHFWDFKKEENAEEDEPTTCMGCYHFEPKGGNLGYCEIQDHVVSINFGCDERKEDEESKDGN